MIPLRPGDDWFENPMQILRTADDATRTPAESDQPKTYINTETHWWDASQIYGSTLAFQQAVRTGTDGKLHVSRANLVAPNDASLVQTSSLAGWWLGQEIMFTLFTLEHNAICDRLRADFPAWDDDAVFEHARLINAALIAKIHTVEWTTAILGHPTLQIAMRANWWGLAMERVHDLMGRISSSEVISGIPGSETNHFDVPYSITEEFVAVYRMHPLIPDDFTFRSALDDGFIAEHTFAELAGTKTAAICDVIDMRDIIYSFGIANPGAVTLHNYPHSLQKFERPDGRIIDLASHDVLRSRELGVPRYNRFRRLLHLRPPKTFEELTANPQWAAELRAVYDGDIESVDLMTGLFAETPPKGFGFSDTAFRIFILMASRRINSDRFFTLDFTPEVYTRTGMQWIDDNGFASILLRHYPQLGPALRDVANPFAPWQRARPN
jgi:Animal haem peroxidase